MSRRAWWQRLDAWLWSDAGAETSGMLLVALTLMLVAVVLAHLAR